MPYIKQQDRAPLDHSINVLLECLSFSTRSQPHGTYDEVKAAAAVAGELNYVLTRLTLGVLKLVSDEPKYSTLALFSGVLTHVGSEFYRRVVSPYEDRKIVENGDLDEFRNGGGVVSENVP